MTGVVQALNDYLLAYDGGSWIGKIQLEEDRSFVPPTEEMWLAVDVNMLQPRLLGGGSEGHYRIQGNYEVNVRVPLGKGTVEAYALATLLVSYFFRGHVLNPGPGSVKIEFSYQGSKSDGPSFVNIPVIVRFWSYQPYQ